MNILDIALPELEHAQVVRSNEAILALSRKVFTIGDQDVFLRPAATMPSPLAKLECLFLGQEFTIYVDAALVDSLLSPFALRLSQMSGDAMTLFLLKHVDKMPKNIQILSICLSHNDLPAYDYAFEMMAYNGNVSTGWHIGFETPQKFPINALVDALSDRLKGVMASSLDSVPIAIPLVVASLSLDAQQITTLELGDVLLLEGAIV